MKSKIASSLGSVVILMIATTVTQAHNLKDVEITDEFPLQRCIDTVGLVTSCTGADCNQYLPLIVDRVWELDNEGCDDCEESEAVTVSILPDTQMVDGQLTRVMEERESVEGELTEVSRNFLNQCPNTQDVYYWGEEVCIEAGSDAAEDPPFEYETPCEEGLEAGGGAWKAGEDGARPGILFHGGAFVVGARYFQEVADNAQDWATNTEMGLTIDDLANGEFDDCVLVVDRNLLEDPKSKRKEGDEKVYCPDIGIVRDEELELTRCTDTMGNCAQ
ncbi:MAG: hypothetical protein IH838_03580 [Proteobacteria bacterium]|nr:hypothetical protein [Pseudomonadota bacterium]